METGPSPAPLPRRTVAFLCDQAVVLLLGVLPAVALGVPATDIFLDGETRQAMLVVLMGIAFVYHFLLEWRWGETPGKRLFDLQVVRDNGDPLGPKSSFWRNLLRGIDGLGYWSVAVAIILLRGDGKRLGDVVGATLVVRRKDLP
jgi:uncharacterized RDD family membrane protein YckC